MLLVSSAIFSLNNKIRKNLKFLNKSARPTSADCDSAAGKIIDCDLFFTAAIMTDTQSGTVATIFGNVS